MQSRHAREWISEHRRNASHSMDDVNTVDHRNYDRHKISDLDSRFRKHGFPALFLDSKEHVEHSADVLIRKDIVPGCRGCQEGVTADEDVDPELRIPSTDNSPSRPVLKNTVVT